MSGAQERLANAGWRRRNSLWIILPPISIGLLTWAAFLYAGTRARRRAWLLAAGGYLVALVAGLGFVPSPGETGFGIRDAITTLLWIIICWLGGTVHAIFIRTEYLRTVAASGSWYQDALAADGGRWPVAQRPPAVSGDAAHTLGLDQEHARLFGPGDAPLQRSGTPPQAPPPHEPPSARWTQVPLNSAGEEDLAGLPGLDPILAKRIVVERQRREGFDVVEDLAECGVPPHVVVRLRSVLYVDRDVPQHPRRERRGRTLDL